MKGCKNRVICLLEVYKWGAENVEQMWNDMADEWHWLLAAVDGVSACAWVCFCERHDHEDNNDDDDTDALTPPPKSVGAVSQIDENMWKHALTHTRYIRIQPNIICGMIKRTCIKHPARHPMRDDNDNNNNMYIEYVVHSTFSLRDGKTH